MKRIPYGRNWITLIGLLIAGVNLALIIILFIISVLFDQSASYIGLFIYIILPGFMLLGLLMIPIGILLARKRKLLTSPEGKRRLPTIDLNNPAHKRAFVIFSIATIIILFLSTYGSFEAYHLTESVEFCGTLCHQVMEPEYTAYQNSPHANVACVDCHVGSGASWYVKSKLSGLHQVWATITKSYEAPIETPLHDLRPARETCEQCHWPQKFYSRKIYTNKYFLADSLNSEWDITLQMKTGPEYEALGFAEGIHWHINPDIRIEYISENDKREVITRIRYTNVKTGESIEYRNPDTGQEEDLTGMLQARTMDCIDCHNRPSHNYSSPPVYFDRVMLSGEVAKDIPFMKTAAMNVLYRGFASRDSAMIEIRDEIMNYYMSEYPGIYEARAADLERSVSAIQRAFSQNNFPAMGVSYSVYPNHIGHQESEGCFRCHNDSFVLDTGRRITRDCNLCHTIVSQGRPGAIRYSSINDPLEFEHPIDIGTLWQEASCSDCHAFLY